MYAIKSTSEATGNRKMNYARSKLIFKVFAFYFFESLVCIALNYYRINGSHPNTAKPILLSLAFRKAAAK